MYESLDDTALDAEQSKQSKMSRVAFYLARSRTWVRQGVCFGCSSNNKLKKFEKFLPTVFEIVYTLVKTNYLNSLR